jgi:hypothetical protein
VWSGSFVLWSFLYDISMLLITKEGSAALMVVSSALSLPVTNIAFTYKWIAGGPCCTTIHTNEAGRNTLLPTAERRAETTVYPRSQRNVTHHRHARPSKSIDS